MAIARAPTKQEVDEVSLAVVRQRPHEIAPSRVNLTVHLVDHGRAGGAEHPQEVGRHEVVEDRDALAVEGCEGRLVRLAERGHGGPRGAGGVARCGAPRVMPGLRVTTRVGRWTWQVQFWPLAPTYLPPALFGPSGSFWRVRRRRPDK